MNNLAATTVQAAPVIVVAPHSPTLAVARVPTFRHAGAVVAAAAYDHRHRAAADVIIQAAGHHHIHRQNQLHPSLLS